MPYFLDIKEYKSIDIDITESYSVDFLYSLNDEQIKQFLCLQSLADKEINDLIASDGKNPKEYCINIIPESTLKESCENHTNWFLPLYVFKDAEMIGYGYSNKDVDSKEVCYINTIWKNLNAKNRKV